MSASPVKKNKENPFLSFESDQDPIMVAARSQKSRIRWRYCTEAHSDLVPMQDDDNEHINIIALGRTGDGKSSLLNDLMGHAVFKQKASARSQTKDIQESTGFWAPLHPFMHDRETFGCNIRVIDTPGFGDSQMRDQEFSIIIKDALFNTVQSIDGLHVILLVFKISATLDTILKSMQSLADLLSPNNDFWDNVIIVFTHVDLVSDHSSRYQAQKVYLKTKVSKALQERYGYQHELPMAWISTQKYTCGFLKGLGDCDCERGNKYHADSRRRLYQQVIQRRHSPIRM